MFEAASASSASAILDKLTVRRDDMIRMYINDKSSEVARLDKAVLYIHGNFVVYVVCDDSEGVLKIVREYLEQ